MKYSLWSQLNPVDTDLRTATSATPRQVVKLPSLPTPLSAEARADLLPAEVGLTGPPLPFPNAVSESGANVPADPSPAGASSRPTVLTVRPHEVNAGDLLVGHPRKPIAVVFLDCGCSPASWLYFGFDGFLVARRSLDAAVQVIRGATPGDECPVFGLERPRRHLEAVR